MYFGFVVFWGLFCLFQNMRGTDHVNKYFFQQTIVPRSFVNVVATPAPETILLSWHIFIHIYIYYISVMLFVWLLREFRCIQNQNTWNKTGDLERLFRSLPTSPRKDHDEISIYLTRLSLDIDTCLATLWSPGPSVSTSKAAALDLQEMEWLGNWKVGRWAAFKGRYQWEFYIRI